MSDLIDACHYGVPRAQCHIGCGRWCRPARRAQAMGNQLVAHEYGKPLKTGGDGGSIAEYPLATFTLKERLRVRHEEEADLYAAPAPHDSCGTAACCGTCQTVPTTNTKEIA